MEDATEKRSPGATARDSTGRYPFLDFRRGVWREIARFVRRDVGPVGALVELGAGYCDFVNQFPAERRVAYDLNPEMKAYAAPGVELHVGDATRLDDLEDDSVDLVFASNFLEHLEMADVERTLTHVHRVLRREGKLVLLQPNHARCADRYFDDPTHKTIFDERIIADVLMRSGFWVRRLEPGLLPFSMKSRLPKWPILTRLYLRSPIKPMAAQMYVVAERR